MMLELSPEDTAANADAPSMPARSSTSRSNPIPSTRSPGNSGESRLNAVLSRSMTATSWPIRARPSASDAPTRPHPITTTRTFAVLSATFSIYALGTLPPNSSGLTLGSRVQAFDRRPAAGPRQTLPKRQALPHASAQADSPSGLRFRRAVVDGLRTRGDLPGAVGGRTGGVL